MEQRDDVCEMEEFEVDLSWLCHESDNATQKAYGLGDVLRIEETVTAGWSGVNGCCDSGTVNGNAKNALEGWVKKKFLEHINHQVLRYGSGQGSASCTNRRAPWPDNSRSCSGALSMPCYIEFWKPRNA